MVKLVGVCPSMIFVAKLRDEHNVVRGMVTSLVLEILMVAANNTQL